LAAIGIVLIMQHDAKFATRMFVVHCLFMFDSNPTKLDITFCSRVYWSREREEGIQQVSCRKFEA
jgi:hypothetical protein